MVGSTAPTIATADEIPLTIDGVINCAHPDNAITTTCRGENPPETTPIAPTATEAPAPGTTIRYSGDRALDCSKEPDASDPLCLPLTIDGVINCANPDNAITTTCRGESQPDITPVPPVTLEAPPPGVTITYSGDIAINCALEENRENNICLPMTKEDGSINCQQADNAITITCWNSFQESQSRGEAPEVDCTEARFATYPVCTGVKPEAVLIYENALLGDSQTVTDSPSAVTSGSATASDSSTPTSTVTESSTTTSTGNATANNLEERTPGTGEVAIQARKSKSTTLVIAVTGEAQSVQIVATKKGARAITRELTLSSDDEIRVRFPRNLKGYSIVLLIDGREVDRIRA